MPRLLLGARRATRLLALRAHYAVILAALAFSMAACDRTHQAATNAYTAAVKTTKKVAKGAKSTGEALRPAASAVAGGFKKGVSGVNRTHLAWMKGIW